MNEMIKFLEDRRSCRSYEKREVPQELLEQICITGLHAPSGMNRQAVRFLCVSNPDMVKKLSMMNAKVLGSESDPFYGAPSVIVVFGDKNMPTSKEDASIALTYLQLAASSLNLGSCWIHRAFEMFESEEGKKIKEEFGIPESFYGVGNLIVGYKSKEASPKTINKDRIVYIK